MTFKPGQSGNPHGRPPGRDVRAALFKQELKKFEPKLIAKVIELALEGDKDALKICLERIYPTPKLRPRTGDEVRLEFPPGATLSEKAEIIVDAALRGEVGLDGATVAMSLITEKARVDDLDQVAKDVAEIKRRLEDE